MSPAALDLSLTRLGWDDGWQCAWKSALAAAGHDCAALDTPGRVIRVDRGLSSVLTATGAIRAGMGGELLERMGGDPVEGPVTGDWVGLRSWPDGRSTMATVLPRRTRLVRATPSRTSKNQLLAANATVVAVVLGLVPDPGIAKAERLLSVAWGSGARPLLVLAKADLVHDAPELAVEVGAQAPGVELVASTVTGAGIGALRAQVGRSGTLALLGPSGVGKSSLVNALVGASVLAERAIRADGRGRHTSVRRELVPLPGGGSVIDTPGLRGVGLSAGASERGMAGVFPDVVALAAGCRFGDCRHDGEPGCEVAAALGDGRLASQRLESWRRLQRELAWRARREAARRR